MPDPAPVQPPAMVVGQLPTLRVEEGGRPTPEAWELFCDKMDSFFRVNAVPVASQRDWLLSCPALTYAEAITLLSTHIEPPKSKFFSRTAINSRRQAKGERVREYVAELCKLAGSCEFRKEDFDLEVLCVLVCNMRDTELQQRLWSQANLTLDSAILQIEASESASDYLVKMRNVNMSSSNVQTINKANHYRAELKGQQPKGSQQQQQQRGARSQQQQRVTSQQGASSSSSQPKCWRCERGRHAAADCRFKTATCNFCGNVGHIKPACRKFKGQNKKGGASHTVQNLVVDQTHEQSVDDYWNNIDWCLSVHPVLNNDSSDNVKIPEPCLITILINQIPLRMEIDSGSGVSLIGRDIYDSCFRDIPLHDHQLMLKAWNSSTLPVSGQINVTATLGQKSAELPLLVMATRGPSLLGRQWFAALGIQSPSPSSRVLHASPPETSTLDATSLPDEIKEFVEEQAIQFVRNTLSSPPVLRSFDNDLPLFLATDACQHGIGCVLSQVQDGVEQPIMFGSRGAGKPIPEVLSPRILRLCLQAAAFDYTLIYREGKKHANADFCSRFPVEPAPQSSPEEPAVVMFMSAGPQGEPVFADAIARETAADSELSQVVVAIERGTPRQKLAKELRAYMVGQPGALAVQAGCILFGARVVIPSALRPQVLRRLHQHHQGIVRTKAVARSYCWWPQINTDIENLIAGCQVCAVRQPDPPKLPMVSWPLATKPMQRIHLDFFGPMFNCYFLVMVCAFSNWLELTYGPNQDAATVIASCNLWFSYLGLPAECVCDNGPAFRAELFSSYLQGHGVKLTFSPPYHPASNGLAERAVRTMKTHLSKLQGPWKQQLPGLLLALRTTPTASGSTPAELMMGRRLTTQLDRMNPNNILSHPPVSTDITNWPINSPLYYRQYLQGGRGEKWLPGVVVGHEGTRILTIQCPDRSIVRRHLDQVRRRSPCMDNDPRSCSQEDYISKKAALSAAEGARERLQQIPTPEVFEETPAVATINAPNQPGHASQEPRRSERLQSQNRQTPSARGARQVSVRPLVAARGGRGVSANRGRH
ncbi:hypothetical protein B566_EDAN018014 [Ephemera danica]|nr:hypothetical protein B566_EDAN018014 [Ephemera danica]